MWVNTFLNTSAMEHSHCLKCRANHNLLESPEISSTQEIPEEGEEEEEDDEEEGELVQGEEGEGPTLLHPHVRTRHWQGQHWNAIKVQLLITAWNQKQQCHNHQDLVLSKLTEAGQVIRPVGQTFNSLHFHFHFPLDLRMEKPADDGRLSRASSWWSWKRSFTQKNTSGIVCVLMMLVLLMFLTVNLYFKWPICVFNGQFVF